MPSFSQAIREPVPEGKGMLHVLDATGDTHIMWDAERPVEVEAARAAFDNAKAAGYQGFSVTASGDKDAVIREFDPEAEKIIMAPALRGG